MRYIFVLLLSLVALQAQAQTAAQNPDMQKRVALAARMADLTPPRAAVDDAIQAIASRAAPEDRAKEQQAMSAAFDYPAFRQIVITRMAETFTTPELQKMVDYNSSPEAQSIAKKMPAYQTSLQPDMTRMLDVALMVARTGAPAAKQQPAK